MIADLDYKQFRAVQAIAKERIFRNKVYWESNDLFNRISKPGLGDASALLRIFEKQLQEHNSKIDADISRIENLNYKTRNVLKSKYFHGINLLKVFKAVEENPNLDYWEIARQFL